MNVESHDAFARCLRWPLVSNQTSLYSQHIKGKENIIADSLSRDFHKSDQTLKTNFNQILPQQTAALFHMKQLPRNVISWISSLAAASALPTASPYPLQPSSLATGKGGEHSSNTQESQTNSRKESHKHRKQSRCHHLPPQCDETSSEKQGKHVLLHGTVKSAISDVYVSFRTHLRSDPTLESSGQTYLII